jgi:hypothetical protein
MLFKDNSINRITERNTITRYTTFYLGKPSRGRKPNKNYLNIDCQYKAKTKTKVQNNKEYPRLSMRLSLLLVISTTSKIYTLVE